MKNMWRMQICKENEEKVISLWTYIILSDCLRCLLHFWKIQFRLLRYECVAVIGLSVFLTFVVIRSMLLDPEDEVLANMRDVEGDGVVESDTLDQVRASKR